MSFGGGAQRKQGINYDCDMIQLFELQSLYYDYYLINIQFVSSGKSYFVRVLSMIFSTNNTCVVVCVCVCVFETKQKNQATLAFSTHYRWWPYDRTVASPRSG